MLSSATEGNTNKYISIHIYIYISTHIYIYIYTSVYQIYIYLNLYICFHVYNIPPAECCPGPLRHWFPSNGMNEYIHTYTN